MCTTIFTKFGMKFLETWLTNVNLASSEFYVRMFAILA